MSNLKKIRLFEQEVLAQGLPASQMERVSPAVHMQGVQVLAMVEVDMFFFFFGSEMITQNGYDYPV